MNKLRKKDLSSKLQRCEKAPVKKIHECQPTKGVTVTAGSLFLLQAQLLPPVCLSGFSTPDLTVKFTSNSA